MLKGKKPIECPFSYTRTKFECIAYQSANFLTLDGLQSPLQSVGIMVQAGKVCTCFTGKTMEQVEGELGTVQTCLFSFRTGAGKLHN